MLLRSGKRPSLRAPAHVPLSIPLAFLGRLIAQRRARRESRDLYRTVVERASEGILLAGGKSQVIVQANRAAARILGLPVSRLVGHPLLSVLDVLPERYALAEAELHASDSVSLGDARVVREDGSIVHVGATANLLSSGGQDLLCVVVHDLTERIRSEESMRHHAFHDPLTGLPNRLLFADRLSMALLQARRAGTSLGVAYLDLDDFKAVNDSLGHNAGDQLLRQAADRLNSAIREGDTVARHGGDEFLILLPDVASPEAALVVIERIADRFLEPFEVQGQVFATTASIGVALFPNDGAVAEDLVHNADLAMYHAKKRGRCRVELFDTGMRQKMQAAIHVRNRLQKALEREEFVIHYQPQVALADGKVTGVEALVRWHDPERGIVPPAEFLRAAEDCGLIIALGEWVMRRVCADARAWGGAGFPGLGVAINLSPQQVRRRGLDGQIERILSETGIDPGRLELEIRENTARQNPEAIRDTLGVLRRIGVRVSLDGLCSWNGSLGELRTLPMDALKLDRSLVDSLSLHQDDAPLMEGIVGLAHTLHLRVVAEGVETRRHLAAARTGHCDQAQGFGLCRPVPWQDVTALLARQDNLLAALDNPSGSPSPAPA